MGNDGKEVCQHCVDCVDNTALEQNWRENDVENLNEASLNLSCMFDEVVWLLMLVMPNKILKGYVKPG